MVKKMLVVILFFAFIVENNAQDIEANLATDDSTSGFTVKNNSGDNLFIVRGNGNVGIGLKDNTNLFHVIGKTLFSGDPKPNNGNILLQTTNYKLSGSETAWGAYISLFSGYNYGDLTIKAGDGYGGNVNILSGKFDFPSVWGYCGDINITAAGSKSGTELEGGSVNITAGAGRPAGDINIKAGNGTTGSSPSSGKVIIAGGDAEGNYMADGGNVEISGGNGAYGGKVIITSGETLFGNSTGGSLELSTGGGQYNGGKITLNTSGGSVNGGNIEFNLGTGVTGVDGKVVVNGSGTYTGTWTQTSDRRFKENIEDLNLNAFDVLQLRPVRYDMRRDEFPDKNLAEGEQMGLIAQEVEELFPQLVRTDGEGFKSIDYTKVSVLLLDVVKDQNEKLEKQNKLLNELVHRIDRLESRNELSLKN
ncbi:MAG: hypothetical protein HND52_16475 [Ignavibacteriae bacterium]|nr:hypothetical protein [Ignavibacteriota bacterium]NOG99554.1 hypothetical protein [Ignavibacteriota bacterium]